MATAQQTSRQIAVHVQGILPGLRIHDCLGWDVGELECRQRAQRQPILIVARRAMRLARGRNTSESAGCSAVGKEPAGPNAVPSKQDNVRVAPSSPVIADRMQIPTRISRFAGVGCMARSRSFAI